MHPPVAIPSHKRAETVTRKTLPLLDRLGAARSTISVFTAPDEVAGYRSSLDAAGYGEVEVRAGALGCARNRNALHAAYPPGVQLMSFDDDVEDIRIVRAGKLESIDATTWQDLVASAFLACHRTRAKLWGGYAAANPFYMSPTITFGLCYIVGCFYGCINWGTDPARQLTGLEAGDPKDDFERSIQCYLADGALVRVNWITAKTAYWKEPGGLQETRTPEAIRDRCLEMARMYPGLCRVVTSKKSVAYDLRLRDTRKRKESHESRSVVA